MSPSRGRGVGSSSASGNLTPDERQARRKEQFHGLGRGRGSRLPESKEQIRTEYEEFMKQKRLHRAQEARRQKHSEDEIRIMDATAASEILTETMREMQELITKREKREKSKFPKYLTKPNSKKYKEMMEKEEGYRASTTIRSASLYLHQRERKQNANLYSKQMEEKGYDYIKELLNDDHIEAIRKTPELIPEMTHYLETFIREKHRKWLYDEFKFRKECPFCLMKIYSEMFARKHIDEVHLAHFSAEALKDFF